MLNRDTEKAWNYHDATKHSYWSVRNNPHFLDWANQPIPLKIYKTLDALPLPKEFPPSGMSALDAIAAEPINVPLGERREPTREQLGRILYCAGGITRRRKYPGGEIMFRAASCTGALYEIELYVICGELDDLPAGVYHWNPADLALRPLRDGDYRAAVVEATAQEPLVAHAPVILVCTGTYWRNAWKYQSRTYRHFGWDNGTLLANLLAVCAALSLPTKLVQGFVDAEINRLLDLNEEKEVAYSMVAVGSGTQPASAAQEIVPLDYPTEPLSSHEIDYPLMREMHAASSLQSAEEVAQWRGAPPSVKPREVAEERFPLRPLSAGEMPADSVEEVILRRGSTRRFAREPISFEQLSTVLDRSTRGLAADFLEPCGSQINDLYLVANAVEGLPPGSYFFNREQGTLDQLEKGNFRDQAGYLGLGQALPADASLAIFYLADLRAVFERFGNRGYRAVQTEAGIIGGRVYLAAYAQRLGATGLTFYDDDVVKFFSPHAEGKSAIFLSAVGKRFKR